MASRKGAKKRTGRTLGLVLLSVLFFGGAQAWGWLRDNRLPAFYGDAQVYVSSGTTPDDVISQIKEQTGIRWEQALRKVFERKRVAQYISPGHYTVKASYSCVYVARMLNNSWQTPIRLTVSPAARLKSEMARSLGSQMQLDSAEIAGAFSDKAFLRKFGFTPANVFSLLLPDTYEVYWDASLTSLFSTFRKEYDRFWDDGRKSKAKAIGLTPEQVSILASIVCRESNYVPEYGKIAGVYITRLRRGMKLQACPTVAYCFDYKPDRILSKHLKVDSPYNTYTHAGLPPGPICFPTKQAIDAVLSADLDSGYLYFCASSELDGTNVFSKTYSEHLKKSKAFQEAAYNKNKKK